jgi:hypothetical protein
MGLQTGGFGVYVNDVDLDTALSVWLLANPERAGERAVRQLVNAAGLLDAHSGAYPIDDEMRRTIEWLSEPETMARARGGYWSLDAGGLAELIERIGERVERYARGEARHEVTRYQVDERYQIERQGTGWVLARTVGTRAHASLFRDGHVRVVMYRALPDGSWAYTVAKRSEFVKHFPVPAILAALAALEPGWGGGSTVGGAPRHASGARSRLAPETVFDVVEAVVRESVHADGRASVG